MDQKRRARRAQGGANRAGNLKGLGGTFDSHISERSSERQDGACERSPIAQTRIVVGLQRYFIFVPRCPFCGTEHAHHLFSFRTLSECAVGSNINHLAEIDWVVSDNLFSDPLLAYHVHAGLRIARCRGNTSLIYRVVPGPLPACFTPLGAKDRNSRGAMTRLRDRGVPTSTEILALRDPGDLYHGDGFPKNR
jgi:hypothetical protein